MSIDPFPTCPDTFSSYSDHALAMESTYLSSLDHLARRRYVSKLQIDGKVFPDPYGIDESVWINDVTTWLDLRFGDIYTYLIDSKGTFTREL